MQTKLQTVNFTLPAGTPAGIYNVPRTELIAGYDRLTGIATYVNLNPQVEFQIAIKDEGEIHQDFTNYRDYTASQSLDFRKRYKPFDIQARGVSMKLEIKVITTLVQPLNVDFVFRLERTVNTNCNTRNTNTPKPAKN
jgi:hypothetical protein